MRIKDREIADKVSTVKQYAVKLIEDNDELSNIYRNIQMSDTEVFEHSMRVTDIAVGLGIQFNFDLSELIDIALGALLHDAGKVFLNPDILYKSGRFDNDEKMLVEAHTNLGYKLVKDLSVSNTVINIIKSHHEKLNGKGYPDGLSLKELSIFVQIVTVADIYDAITSKRCYHEEKSKEEALEIMKKDSGLNQVAVELLDILV